MDISKEIPKPLVVVLRLQCTRAQARPLEFTIQAVWVSGWMTSAGTDSGAVTGSTGAVGSAGGWDVSSSAMALF
ncbi:MAG TPA: hypothetical protein VI957_02570 [Candidatus Paceibacterota bacterium]